MFLTKIRSRARDDSGSTMVAVIGMVAVAALITTVVTVSTLQALAYTTSTRAGVQSQAAADAGVEFLLDRLKADSCIATATRTYGEVYTPAVLAAEAAALGEPSLTLSDLGVAASDPYFTAKVQYKALLSGAWTDGCPPRSLIGGLLNYQVRVESTGHAASEGLNGVSALDQSTVEAVYGWNILTLTSPGGPPPTQLYASGPAVYAYASDGFGGSGTLISVGGSTPGVLIKEGTVTCNGASSGIADIVAGDGNITINGSCKVDGNVWASGSVTVDGGTGVAGSVIGNGVTASVPIGGSIWSTGDVNLTWGNSVGGSVTAKNLTATGVTIAKNVVANGYIKGTQTTFREGINATEGITLTQLSMSGKVVGRSLTLDGGVSLTGSADIYGRADATNSWSSSAKNVTATVINFTNGNSVTGTKTLRSSPTTVPGSAITQNAATPARPTVPEWVDFGYVKDDWIGFTEVVMTGNCNAAALRTKLATVTGPVLVKATGCSNGVIIGDSDKIALDRDVAIFASKFDLGGSGGFTSTSASRLWLIQPDTVKPLLGILGLGSTQPHCGGQSFSLGGGFSFADSVTTMIYSPCKVELASSTVLKGQIYAGKVTIAGAAQLKYVRVGLPGVDLDTGATSAPGGIIPLPPVVTGIGGSLGDLDYYRDVPSS